MALQTRRVITAVEDISSARTSPAPHVRRRVNPSPQPFTTSRSNLPSNKPLQVSFASPARRPLPRAGITEKGPVKTRPVNDRSELPARTFPSRQNHRTLPSAQNHRTLPSAESHPDAQSLDQNALSSHDHGLVPSSVNNVEEPSLEVLHSEHDATKNGAEKGDQTETSERVSPAEEVPDADFSSKRGSGNTESYYSGQTDSDNDQNGGVQSDVDQVGRPRERKPKHNQQEWRSMATYAKAQGIDLMRQIEEQKRRQMEQEQEPVDIAKAEMEEMKKILQEQRRSSSEYLIPTETERDSSPERNSSRRDYSSDRHSRKDSADSEIYDQVNLIKNEHPSKVFDWLRAADEDGHGRIAVSENRTLSLLQAIKEGSAGVIKGPSPGLQEDWVPMERFREAERRSSVAEEQIRQFEELLNAVEGSATDEQLRALLSRSKTMERHFHHMKKFVDDRHSELKKLYSLQDKDTLKTWRPHSGVSPEKIRKDFQEHETHKKRLMQVYSVYNDLLKFLRIEHSRRVEAESKSQHLTSQIKRQTAALRKAEKVIKHSALSPLMANESSLYRPDLRSPSPTPSGIHTPRMANYTAQLSPFDHSLEAEEVDQLAHLENTNRGTPILRRINTTGKSNIRAAGVPSSAHSTITKQLSYDLALEQALSRNPSPEPGTVLSNSDLIAQNHKKEFEELERALIEEGKSRGFADVDLYSEKTTVGKEETCWEYRRLHLDFVRPNQARSPSPSHSAEQGCETLNLRSLSNLPISKRTASPSRSEGAIFEEKHNHLSTNVGALKPLAATDHGERATSPLESILEGRHHHQQQQIKQSRSSFHSASAEEPESETTKKQIKVYQRIQSLPAEMNESSQVEIYHVPLNKLGDSTFYAAISALEDESWEDVAHDALDEMWVDVVKEELWVDAAGEEDWSDTADGRLHDRTEMKQTMKDDTALRSKADVNVEDQGTGGSHPSSRDTNVDSQIGPAVADDSRPSDLQQRIAAVESGHVAQRLQEQVKRRRWLLVLQVFLFMVALLWSATWRGSEPPPT